MEALGVGPGDQLELSEGPDGFILRPRRVDRSRLGTLHARIPPAHPPFDIATFRKTPYEWIVRRFRAWDEDAVGAVGYQIESFQNDLTDQRLAERRTDDTVDGHGAVAEAQGEGAGGRSFLSALVRVCDDHGPRKGRSEPLDDILRQHEHNRAGIDDRSHARAPDVGLLTVSPLEDTTVDRILQLGVNDDLAHFPPPCSRTQRVIISGDYVS